MNNTEVSVYENVSVNNGYSESVLYQAINNVLSISTTNGNKVFCPFCIKTYDYKFSLLDHLKYAHYNFLCGAAEKSFLFEQCPFCNANFFGKHTIVRHVLQAHSRVIAQLYLSEGNSPKGNKCFFCCDHYERKSISEFISHIDQKHFLQFTELFQEQFLKLNDSFVSPKNNVIQNSIKNNLAIDVDQENCFDFACVKEQLCNINGRRTIDENQPTLKSILKHKKKKLILPSSPEKAKVCRVLKFDAPNEDKGNSVFAQNIKSPKQITFAEHSLLCNNDAQEQIQLDSPVDLSHTLNLKPIHSSTPNSSECENMSHPFEIANKKIKLLQSKKKLKVKKRSTFKSYFFKKYSAYQCGKCKKVFQENNDLNYHIKKNHKLFILNLLHPCYQCAICNAKFFKNYYLKKHIMLHSSIRESNELNQV